MRQLKFHEKKLLKKVDFYKVSEDNAAANLMITRFKLSGQKEYYEYKRIVVLIRTLLTKMTEYDQEDPFRVKLTEQLGRKLYQMGIIPTENHIDLKTVSIANFCRRRIPVVLLRMQMASSLTEATTYVQHGHVRIGPEIVTDPAFFVSRSQEDFLTWVDSSKIKKHVLRYNDELDDYDLMQ
eukprot:TRINITY_DN4219_c0_g2_i1.p1 TRINITY_DN4219_c0_g2~~TRINITY_DN4219_c0_g2_i1.p1  ORF type:complete len:181 (+),score=28.29 TRINITY_DN4219_c0_g2_i1:278-820(+)